MRDLPLKKLRNFGGKLGAELDAMGCRTAGDVAALPLATLRARFGEERAAFIAAAVRGDSNEPVQVCARICALARYACDRVTWLPSQESSGCIRLFTSSLTLYICM